MAMSVSDSKAQGGRLIALIERAGGKAEGWDGQGQNPIETGEVCGRVYLGQKWAHQGVGIDSLRILKSVGELVIDYAECSDGDLRVVARMPHLESLVLLNGRFTSDGLRALRDAPNLKSLSVSGKACDDVDLDAFKGLDLMCLSLNGAKNVTVRRMAPLAGQRQLSALEIVNCQLKDQGEIDFGFLPNLRFLSVSNTRVSDSDLDGIASLRFAQVLNLSNTAIKAPIVSRLKELPDLRRLIVNDVKLSNDALQTLLELDKLESLEIDGSQFGNSHLALLAGMKALRSLSVRRTPVELDAFMDVVLPSNLKTVRQGSDNTLVLDSKWIGEKGYGRDLIAGKSQLYVRGKSGIVPVSRPIQ